MADPIHDLLTSQPIRDDLARRAGAIARAAGAGFEVRTGVGPDGAHAEIWAVTEEAVQAELEDGVLTRAIDAGR